MSNVHEELILVGVEAENYEEAIRKVGKSIRSASTSAQYITEA